MLSRQNGFSLLETLLAMVIGSVLLLAAARFLPALQLGILQQMRVQLLEDELWQRIYTLSRHLQRAGYCNGHCEGEPVSIGRGGECVIVQWDANSNGRWDTTPTNDADQTGFRLQNGVLETLRGATSCEGKGWDKWTDPAFLTIKILRIINNRFLVFSRVFPLGFAGKSKRLGGRW